MGGPIPLGYKPHGRTLTIVEPEAETVRTIFRLYLELGTVRQVQEEARRLGLRSKQRQGARKQMRGGRLFGRGHLYHLLSNPLYAGRVPHNGDSYEGQHPAIVDPETWEAAQKQLASQTPARSARGGVRTLSPLRGKLFDESSTSLTPSHTQKSGRRYRYYVSREPASQASTPPTKASAENGGESRWRLPAREIERLVGEAVVSLFSNPAELAQWAREAEIDVNAVPQLLERVAQWDWKPLEIVQRVDLAADEIVLHIDLSVFLAEQRAVVRHALPTRIR